MALKNLVILALAFGMLAGGVAWWNSPEQKLKTQYFAAVCDIEPYWFSRSFSDQTVTEALREEVEDVAQAMGDRGVNPSGARKLVRYLLKVMPEDVLWYNAHYTISRAVEARLLREDLSPAVSESTADARSREVHKLYRDANDPMLRSLRFGCSPVIFGRAFGNG